MSRKARHTATQTARTAPIPRKSAGRTRSHASVIPPATTSSVPIASGTLNGSERITSASSADNSGEVPISTAARDGPAFWIAPIQRICEKPGTMRPMRRKGHASPRCASSGLVVASVMTNTSANAITAVTNPPMTASGDRRRAIRTATLTTPKQTPASSARRTTVTRG